MIMSGKRLIHLQSPLSRTTPLSRHSRQNEDNGLTPTELSLAFVNQQEFVTSNIIGATKMDQLKENINSVDIELSKEILDEINDVHENNPSPAP